MKDNYGNLAGGLIPEFSVLSYVPTNMDNLGTVVTSYGLLGAGGVVKIGFLNGASSLSGWVSGSDAVATTVVNTSVKYLKFAAILGYSFGTTADIYAFIHCGCRLTQ